MVLTVLVLMVLTVLVLMVLTVLVLMVLTVLVLMVLTPTVARLWPNREFLVENDIDVCKKDPR